MAMTKLNKIIQQWLAGCRQPPLPWYAVSHGYEGGSGLALGLLQLVGKGELGCLLLQLGELVLVLGDLLEGGLDELALHVTDGDGELVDLEVAEDDLALQEEHLALQVEPLVEVLLDDLLELVVGGVVDILLDAAPLGNDPLAFGGFSLLLFLQLLGGLFTQQSTELLLPLGSHESLLLSHLETQGPPATITNPLVV